MLGANLLAGKRQFTGAWNFGPDAKDTRTVAQVLAVLESAWPGLHWLHVDSEQPHESAVLSLDSSRARTLLGWRPVWTIDKALAATAVWYRRFLETRTVLSHSQLEEYLEMARGNALTPANA
jgi:CDP-glucose 4,6-dehydratase